MIARAPHDACTLHVERTRHDGPTLTRGACEAASAFGLVIDDLAPIAPAPARFALHLSPGALTLVVGPSGSGKSTLLRDVAHAADEQGWTVVLPPAHTRGPKVCADRPKGRDVHERLRALASAGLAEARTALRPPGALSTGERERLRLALAIAKAELLSKRRERVLLVVDEFASALDHATSDSLAHAISRFARRTTRVRVVVATNRGELARQLRPTNTLALDGAGALRIACERPVAAPEDRFDVRPAPREDLDAMVKYHYRPGTPATVVRVLSAREKRTGNLAGILAISMPTLNASWRATAWPGLFETDDKREHARRINETLRCVSRVIVAPEHRACGVAVRLVRAYLRDPITPHTEAIAAMGRACPFFERAGMTAHEPPIPARDARLLDAIDHAGVRERWRLATPLTALQRFVEGSSEAFVEREVRRWASDCRATSSRTGEPIAALFERACRALATTPLVYTHTIT